MRVPTSSSSLESDWVTAGCDKLQSSDARRTLFRRPMLSNRRICLKLIASTLSILEFFVLFIPWIIHRDDFNFIPAATKSPAFPRGMGD
jgi:hypothetical protein